MIDGAALRGLLRGKYSSLTIEFNRNHAANGCTAQEWHDKYGGYKGDGEDYVSWVSESERLKALRENAVWTIQWYPDTQIGFYCVGASTLEAALNAALEEDEV